MCAFSEIFNLVLNFGSLFFTGRACLDWSADAFYDSWSARSEGNALLGCGYFLHEITIIKQRPYIPQMKILV